MSLKASLPGYRDPIVGQGGIASRPIYAFLQEVALTVDGLSDQSGNVTIPELPISENANVVGASGFSVYTQGTLKTGIVRVLLMGDTQNPGNTQYYGSGPTGARGWFNVSDTLAASSNVTLAVGTDGVTTFDLADLANSGTGAALVKLTRDAKGRISGTSAATTSDLTEGSNLYYTDARASAAAPVQSVNGFTGTVSLTAPDVGAATTAQGAKADSAVQSIVAGTGVSVDATDPHNPVVSATGGGGSGDVVGPASAADSGVALYDGTTGKLLKDGGSLATAVRAVLLTGLSLATSAAIAATDTVLAAFGKLQAQITDNLLPKGYIDGLQMKWVSGTALTVTSGAAYIEGSGKVLRATADIAKTGLSLTASTWYHVYLYSNAGTPDIEIVTTAPASSYNGTARSKTGDASRRYVGSVKTDAAAGLFKFVHAGANLFWSEDSSGAPFRVLSDGQAATKTTVSCGGACPVTATAIHGRFYNSSSSTTLAYVATAGSNGYQIGLLPGSDQSSPLALNSSQQLEYTNPTTAGAGRGAYIDIRGFIFAR